MKKNRFFLLVAFALFVMLPFGVNAEVNSVKKIGNKVYVVDDFELDIECGRVQEPEYYSLGVENLIGIYDNSDDEVYIYDFTTKECRPMTEEDDDKYGAEEPNISYEVRDNKLWKIESHHKFRQYYVKVSSDKIVDGGIYYQSPESAIFEKVSSDECLNSNTVCYERKDLYLVNGYKDDGNDYYKYEGYGIVSLLTPETENTDGSVYIEVNRDEYVVETEIINNVSEFETKAKLSMSLSEVLYEFNYGDVVFETITLNNKEYIYIYYNENEKEKIVTNLYSSDGILITTDFVVGGFKVVGNYLEGEDGYEAVYSYIVIKEYELLQGENQKYENNSLTFKTNGDYSLFKNIEINGIELDKNNYVIEEGSTIVTLKNDYLKTLENDTYDLKITYKDGGYVETTFEVANYSSSKIEYKLILDANGGMFDNGTATTNFTFTGKIEDMPKPTREGYSFDGWYTKKDGGVNIAADVGNMDGMTFYAHWKENFAGTTPTNPDVENPKTFDGIGTSIFVGTISLIGLVGATIYLKKRNKVRA